MASKNLLLFAMQLHILGIYQLSGEGVEVIRRTVQADDIGESDIDGNTQRLYVNLPNLFSFLFSVVQERRLVHFP